MMKLKKGIAIIFLSLFTLILICSFQTAYAASSMTLGIDFFREAEDTEDNGVKTQHGYLKGVIGNEGKQIKIWKIVEYLNGSSTKNYDKAIYCIKAGLGFGSNSASTTSKVVYNQKFDLTQGRDAISAAQYRNLLPTGENYNSLLWLLNNMYLPNKEADENAQKEYRNAFITRFYDWLKTKQDITYGVEDIWISDNQIEAVQQLAIWYFTNSDDTAYHTKGLNLMTNLESGTDNPSKYCSLENAFPAKKGSHAIGYYQSQDAAQLLNYLIEKAEEAKNTPFTQTQSTPITLYGTAPTAIKTSDENSYILGKYRIDKTSDIPYISSINVTDQNGRALVQGTDYYLLDSNRNQINKSIEQLVRDNFNGKVAASSEFYIRIPVSRTTGVNPIKGVNFNILVKYDVRSIDYWSTDTPAQDQPLVLVETTPRTYTAGNTVEIPEEEVIFDLSLRKFITEINDEPVEIDREPDVSVTPLLNKTATTATYTHPKNKLSVRTGDKVKYTIRVYNEGEVDGYAMKIVDYLPEGLKLAENSDINDEYGWQAVNGDPKKVQTTYLEDTLLYAFDERMRNLDYADVEIECEVIAETKSKTNNNFLKNVAEITEHKTDEGDNKVKDRDSYPNNISDKVPNYGTVNVEDDDDFEDLELLEFDLSLRKFITNINGTEITSRIPAPNITPLANKTGTTAIYTHPKNPVSVCVGDVVTYTIRVYNEGEIAGYAEEIIDHLPSELQFITDDELNATYKWRIDPNDPSMRTIKTNYLSKDTDENNIINAFDGTNLHYKELKIKCRVNAITEIGRKITNIADITKAADENGRDVKDRDSTPNNVNLNVDFPTYKDDEINRGDTYIPGQQDDDDFEKLRIQQFDLSLRKFITKIDDKEIVNRVPKVTIDNGKFIYTHTKEPLTVKTGDIVVYTLRIYNEGDMAGYAKQIKDDIPEGLKFLPEHETNTKYGWKPYDASGNLTTDLTKADTVRTDYLSKEQEKTKGENLLLGFNPATMTEPDHKDVKIAFEVVEPNSSDRIVINTAEISNDSDENGGEVTDIDSFPNNNKEGEDDIDIEKIKLLEFDLSLRKFITGVNNEERQDREPNVIVNGDEIKYVHPKDPILVKNSDIVTYTIRIYNEGEVAGYAKEIKDNIPEGLEFLPEDDLNKEHRWKMYDKDGNITQDVKKAVTIKTDYLSKEQEKTNGENLIPAFDRDTMEKPSHKDVKVNFKVIAPNTSGKIIINTAEISSDSDENGKDVIDRDSTPDNSKEGEDDIDIEKIKLLGFDLSLRKFITGVNGEEREDRIPDVIVEGDSISYVHPKDPVLVANSDIVTYTIRIYNEGEISGYAKEVKDDIPEGLEFLPEDNLNKEYRWKMYDKDGNETQNVKEAASIKTDYLSKEQEKEPNSNLIVGFDRETMEKPSYKDVKVNFKVAAPNTSGNIVINTAEISNDADENGNEVNDKDSTPDNNKEGEDDIDIEKIKLLGFDLSLRKFITGVNDEEITNREPKVSVDSEGNFKYEHTKEPILVTNKDIVTYTLRIYNEGEISGYAKEVKDDIPQGLEFLPENSLNKEYRWKMYDKEGKETKNVKEAVTIKTDYLSKEQEKEPKQNLILAYTPGMAETPDFRDVKVSFKVVEPETSDRIVINTAEISKDSDEYGNEVEDEDSTPDNNKDGEDDIDIEKIRVKYFDLALKKWVTQAIVIENGKETITETGHTGDENPEPIVKVDLHRKKVNSVIVKFRYKIKVTNEGEIAGYAKEVKDYIPDGLKFDQKDNPKWMQVSENVVTTDQLKDTLLNPGESATVEILLTWINSENNMGKMVNIAEISKDYNESETPDIDSVPDNKKEGEDDIDDAPVMLTVATGAAPVYVGLTLLILTAIAGGVIAIRKYII